MTLTKAEELRIFLAASFVGAHSDILLDTDRLRSIRPFDFGKRNLTKKNILATVFFSTSEKSLGSEKH